MAQFVLVNVVVAVLMKHLEESHKQMEDELDMECELERELAAEQEELLEEAEEELAVQQAIEMALDQEKQELQQGKKSLSKVLSLPANFTFSTPRGSLDIQDRDITLQIRETRRGSSNSGDFRYNYHNYRNRHSKRRQTFHSHQGLLLPPGIPPAYPATGYTAVYSSAANMDDRLPPIQQDDGKSWLLPGASKEKDHKIPVRRVGSDPPAGDFLSVPKLQQRDLGSTQRLNLTELLVNNGNIRGSRHELWLHPQQHLGSPSSAAPSEDVSPECVSPAVMLVPPPYRAATMQLKSSTTTPEEEGDVEPCPDEIDDNSPRRTTLNYSVDSGTGHESLPRYGFNLRSTSGSSSDVPPDTDGASGETNPRQIAQIQPSHTVPSSSQPSVEDDVQHSPPETSVETLAVPVPVTEVESSASEDQNVRDIHSSCECITMQETNKSVESLPTFAVKLSGSKERLVVSVSSEECCEEESTLHGSD
ncbi:hypothetical protein L9F63_023969, partial [Diploptera punctata]